MQVSAGRTVAVVAIAVMVTAVVTIGAITDASKARARADCAAKVIMAGKTAEQAERACQ